MKILFWNTNKNGNINQHVAQLVKENDIDIFVAAEYEADKDELTNMFKVNDQHLVSCNTLGCDRISIWSNYINVKPVIQSKYYSIQIIQDKFILCSVHLITNLHGDMSEERLAITQQLMHDIKETENTIHSQKTIIIGDFNEMPYGKSCLNANGLHGLPAFNVEDRPTRVVNDKEYTKYYNPMWSLLGDFSYPPGTYYLNQSKLNSPMWYMLDQVIISRDILPLFEKDKLRIITSYGCMDLADRNKHPNRSISDHFPIMCVINDK
ncbi:MAG: endonuclease/exonuclease/phosphatase family protein [Tyzzerella sp.]|nr:endonuclease/exonuclease/phosphatase family protein [Tyzzerella sp.]